MEPGTEGWQWQESRKAFALVTGAVREPHLPHDDLLPLKKMPENIPEARSIISGSFGCTCTIICLCDEDPAVDAKGAKSLSIYSPVTVVIRRSYIKKQLYRT